MAFELERPWTLSPQVSLRPERFGALAYHFGTWVPPFSPILMPYQQATGQAGPGLVTLAVVLMLAATALFTAIGGRVYARSVLRSGGRVRLAEALRR